jgi:hypothetical protein
MIPKRAFWFVAGVGAGVAAVIRTQREIPNPSDRDDPAKLLQAANGLTKKAGGRVKDRIEGR